MAQEVEVSRPAAAGTVVTGEDTTEFEPLVALSTAYALGRRREVYASIAEGYRPTVFSESVVPDRERSLPGTWTRRRPGPTRWYGGAESTG